MIIDGTRSNDRSIELVLAYYSALNHGDWDGMLVLLGDNVVHDINQGPREVGKAAFGEFLWRMHTRYHQQLRDIVVMASADGSRAAAEFVIHGEYVADNVGMPFARGQRYLLPGGAFFEVRNGLIQRVRSYANQREWIAQVG